MHASEQNKYSTWNVIVVKFVNNWSCITIFEIVPLPSANQTIGSLKAFKSSWVGWSTTISKHINFYNGFLTFILPKNLVLATYLEQQPSTINYKMMSSVKFTLNTFLPSMTIRWWHSLPLLPRRLAKQRRYREVDWPEAVHFPVSIDGETNGVERISNWSTYTKINYTVAKLYLLNI